MSASSQTSTSAKDADVTSSSKILASGSGVVEELSPGSSTVRTESRTSAGGLATGSAVSDGHKSQSLLVPGEDSNEGAGNGEGQASTASEGTPVSQKSLTDATGPADGDDKKLESSHVTGVETVDIAVPSVAPVKRIHKKQYIFKGPASALAVQLFAIDEKYEMR